MGDEYFCFVVECEDPKACTILLRGASKDVLNEVERNLQDAMQVTRNVLLEPKLVPGGGAAEMALAYVILYNMFYKRLFANPCFRRLWRKRPRAYQESLRHRTELLLKPLKLSQELWLRIAVPR